MHSESCSATWCLSVAWQKPPGHTTSPSTGEPLTSSELFPNQALEKAIQDPCTHMNTPDIMSWGVRAASPHGASPLMHRLDECSQFLGGACDK